MSKTPLHFAGQQAPPVEDPAFFSGAGSSPLSSAGFYPCLCPNAVGIREDCSLGGSIMSDNCKNDLQLMVEETL